MFFGWGATLATERILAEFQRVIQKNSNMPTGGKGNKRSEVNLEKHLEKKRSIGRIRNDGDLCMARALVVAKLKPRLITNLSKTGRDGTGRDGTGRDGTGRDGTGRDGTGQDKTSF